jgi:hypothetical protein
MHEYWHARTTAAQGSLALHGQLILVWVVIRDTLRGNRMMPDALLPVLQACVR